MSDQTQERVLMTLEEYLLLPESDQKMELIHGELITYGGSEEAVSPAPKDRHGEIIVLLIGLLSRFVPLRELRADNVDVHLAGGHVLRPDVLWFSQERGQCVCGEDGYLHGGPDLVIEVLSSATAARDRGVKYELYEAAGVREYWLVDDEARFIEVYQQLNERFSRLGLFGLGQRFVSGVLNNVEILPDEILSEN
jgi:Uma2 family endonuclease